MLQYGHVDNIVICDAIINSISRLVDDSCSKTEIILTHNVRLQYKFTGTLKTVQSFNLLEGVIEGPSF